MTNQRSFVEGAIVLEMRDNQVWLCDPPVGTGLKSMHELFEEPQLAALGTTHVIASPPTAYLLLGEGRLGLEDVTSGEYSMTWIDLNIGTATPSVDVTLDGGDEAFDAPSDALLVLRRLTR